MENKNENIQALNEEEMEKATGGLNIPLVKKCPACGHEMPLSYWGLFCPHCNAPFIED